MMSGAGLPLAASTNEPSSALMNSALSVLRTKSRLFCNADRMAAARGWPDTASIPTPWRMVS